MPIGGLKEKLLAAHRARHHDGRSSRKENRKDLREVPRRVLKATRVVLVEHMDEVLREALALPDPDAVFGPPRESCGVHRRRARRPRPGRAHARLAAKGVALPGGGVARWRPSSGDGGDGGVPAPPTGNA